MSCEHEKDCVEDDKANDVIYLVCYARVSSVITVSIKHSQVITVAFRALQDATLLNRRVLDGQHSSAGIGHVSGASV